MAPQNTPTYTNWKPIPALMRRVGVVFFFSFLPIGALSAAYHLIMSIQKMILPKWLLLMYYSY